MVLIAVLIKSDEKIGFITSGQHFARTDADLKNRRTTRDRRGDGHVRHDIVLAASSQAREKCASCLDSVLRISRETDHCILNNFGAQISSLDIWRVSLCGTVGLFGHGV